MIDSTQWPYRVLLNRGIAKVDTVEGVALAYPAPRRAVLRRGAGTCLGGTGAYDVCPHGSYFYSAYVGGPLGLRDALSQCH
jgi:hypothetical protein